MRLRLGPGPVFAYEWLRTSRRWQMYALRSLFVLTVASGFLVVWWSNLEGRPLLIRDLAATGESFFYALVGTSSRLSCWPRPLTPPGPSATTRRAGPWRICS